MVAVRSRFKGLGRGEEEGIATRETRKAKILEGAAERRGSAICSASDHFQSLRS